MTPPLDRFPLLIDQAELDLSAWRMHSDKPRGWLGRMVDTLRAVLPR